MLGESPICWARNGLALGLGLVSAVIAFLTVGSWAESTLNPPVHGWTVTSIRAEGPDLLLNGTLEKTRFCEHVKPPRAKTSSGVNLLVVSSSQNTSSWLPGDEPQRWGEWRVRGAVGQEVTSFLEYRCHALWPIFVKLGTLSKEQTSEVQK